MRTSKCRSIVPYGIEKAGKKPTLLPRFYLQPVCRPLSSFVFSTSLVWALFTKRCRQVWPLAAIPGSAQNIPHNTTAIMAAWFGSRSRGGDIPFPNDQIFRRQKRFLSEKVYFLEQWFSHLAFCLTLALSAIFQRN